MGPVTHERHDRPIPLFGPKKTNKPQKPCPAQTSTSRSTFRRCLCPSPRKGSSLSPSTRSTGPQKPPSSRFALSHISHLHISTSFLSSDRVRQTPFVLQRIHDDAVSKKDPPLSSIRFALWLIRSTNKSHITHGLQILQELLSDSHRNDPLLSFAFAVGLMYHRDFSEASNSLLFFFPLVTC